MKVALIGLPQSGKTTMFRALVGPGVSKEKGLLNLGIVKVPDKRVEKLAQIYNPKRTVYAQIEVVEATAVHKGDKKGGQGSTLDPALLNLLKPMDAFLLVTRAFDEEGLCEPRADVEAIIEEMMLSDLMVLEARLERDELDRKKGKSVIPAEELDALTKCRELLESGRLIAEAPDVANLAELRTYAFLTARPILVIANVAEADAGTPIEELLKRYDLPVRGLQTFACCAQIEAELQELPDDERPDFMEALGITEPAVNIVIEQVYKALGLISFLTTGEDECRAWTIRKGTLAPKAAGVVHSDIEKGFIRAEVIAYDEFEALGSDQAAKKAGKYRLEGREYAVQDGDIIHFRFNV